MYELGCALVGRISGGLGFLGLVFFLPLTSTKTISLHRLMPLLCFGHHLQHQKMVWDTQSASVMLGDLPVELNVIGLIDLIDCLSSLVRIIQDWLW